jgi:hypothetical protein
MQGSFTFSLERKSNKKFKANAKLRRFALPTHNSHNANVVSAILFTVFHF